MVRKKKQLGRMKKRGENTEGRLESVLSLSVVRMIKGILVVVGNDLEDFLDRTPDAKLRVEVEKFARKLQTKYKEL